MVVVQEKGKEMEKEALMLPYCDASYAGERDKGKGLKSLA